MPILHGAIFISYAREDQEYVQRVCDALTQRGRAVWVDWRDIPPTAEWWKEIGDALAAADAVLVVLSPAFARSEMCAREVALAESQRKRLIPLVYLPVQPQEAYAGLASLQWLDGSGPVEEVAGRIQAAADLDLKQARYHANLLVRANLWHDNNRSASRLFSRGEVDEADRWVAQSRSPLSPGPTDIQLAFLDASRRSAQRVRQRLLAVAATTILVLVLALILTGGLGLYAWVAGNRAERSAFATASSNVSEALRIAPEEPWEALTMLSDPLENPRTELRARWALVAVASISPALRVPVANLRGRPISLAVGTRAFAVATTREVRGWTLFGQEWRAKTEAPCKEASILDVALDDSILWAWDTRGPLGLPSGGITLGCFPVLEHSLSTAMPGVRRLSTAPNVQLWGPAAIEPRSGSGLVTLIGAGDIQFVPEESFLAASQTTDPETLIVQSLFNGEQTLPFERKLSRPSDTRARRIVFSPDLQTWAMETAQEVVVASSPGPGRQRSMVQEFPTGQLLGYIGSYVAYKQDGESQFTDPATGEAVTTDDCEAELSARGLAMCEVDGPFRREDAVETWSGQGHYVVRTAQRMTWFLDGYAPLEWRIPRTTGRAEPAREPTWGAEVSDHGEVSIVAPGPWNQWVRHRPVSTDRRSRLRWSADSSEIEYGPVAIAASLRAAPRSVRDSSPTAVISTGHGNLEIAEDGTVTFEPGSLAVGTGALAGAPCRDGAVILFADRFERFDADGASQERVPLQGATDKAPAFAASADCRVVAVEVSLIDILGAAGKLPLYVGGGDVETVLVGGVAHPLVQLQAELTGLSDPDSGAVTIWNRGQWGAPITDTGLIEQIALSPDGTQLFIARSTAMALLATSGPSLLWSVPPTDSLVTSVVADPAGRFFAAGDAGGRLSFWSANAGDSDWESPLLATLYLEPISSIAIATDGHAVAALQALPVTEYGGSESVLTVVELAPLYETIPELLHRIRCAGGGPAPGASWPALVAECGDVLAIPLPEPVPGAGTLAAGTLQLLKLSWGSEPVSDASTESP